MERDVVWTPVVRNKLIQFRSPRFTPDETLDFIIQLLIEIEEILKTPELGKMYTEEYGEYKGITRIVVRRFRIYFKIIENDILVLAVLFPGEK